MSLPAISSSLSTSSIPNGLRAVSRPLGYSYLLSTPVTSGTEPERGWPLILFLHGVSERGSQVTAVARQALPRLLDVSNPVALSLAESEVSRFVAERFIVIAPQCPQYEVWHEGEIIQLLDHVGEQFHVDSARVYLTGLSMGGFGAWAIALRQPRRFAALVPVCGGGRIADIETAVKENPDALRSLGVWAFHGARDRVVPLEESERMIDALRQAGVTDVKFTIYPQGEHDAWTATYANPDLYRWLLHHSR
jgi:predicted peptidase